MTERALTPRWLTISSAAKYAGVCPNTMRKLVDEGEVDAGRTPGGHRRVDRESIDGYFNRDQEAALAIVRDLGL
jgi:excisionase family DNA binding protein